MQNILIVSLVEFRNYKISRGTPPRLRQKGGAETKQLHHCLECVITVVVKIVLSNEFDKNELHHEFDE